MSRPAEAPAVDRAELAAYCERARAGGRRLVLTNGCFDLLHGGHVAFLRSASTFGDALVVGVNDDRSVRSLKGNGRPLLPLEDRLELLAAIRWVDAVTAMHEATADALIERVRPDVYVKGADYDASVGGRDLPEQATVDRLGIQVRFVPLVPGRSSRDLISRVQRQT